MNVNDDKFNRCNITLMVLEDSLKILENILKLE